MFLHSTHFLYKFKSTHHLLVVVYLYYFLIGGALYFLNVNTPTVYAQRSNEYVVKAAFLYNLARMVEWPEDKVKDNKFTFCFLGTDLFGDALDAIKNKKVVNNRTIVIKKNITLDEAAQCQILFISFSEFSNLASIFSHLKNRPVLTVGDMIGFTEQGGIINSVIQGERMQIEVNRQAERSAGLKISSRLLILAKIVKD